jgi:hypothetical protein
VLMWIIAMHEYEIRLSSTNGVILCELSILIEVQDSVA